ncbi:PQQ-binding-like beta-propeller repeat protein [Actinoplanes sp. NPDC024001]|uniref:outer membrane protein assembly factor BamB family protein n=1 Tax=Actinoplanes sp. NPDC024001 TaxID=3154598 RepID=UPI0033D08408
MSGVLIDLGEVSRGGSRLPAAALPVPPVPYRLLLVLLTAVLLASLAGSGARAEPASPAVIPAALGDAIRVVGDRLFVIGRDAAEGERTIRAYALPDATLLSEHTVAVSGDVLNVDVAGDLLLVTVQEERTVRFGTIALRSGIDQPLWQRPVQLQGVSAAEGLALVRQEGAAFGDAEWQGVDLRTGKARWTVRQGDRDDVGVSSYTGGYPKWLYILTGDGRLVARDTRTGRVVAAVPVPERRDVATSLWPAGDLVLIGAGGSGTTGYDITTGLEPRWHTGMNLSWYRGPAQCGNLICAFLPQRGILVIDPASGRERWSSDRWDYAERIGDRLLTGMPGTAYPRLYVLDPETGDVLADMGLWQSAGPGPEPGTAYVRRTTSGEDRLWYGVLHLDRLRIRVLGAADRVAGDCHFTAGVLVCRRVDASIGVWRLR